MVLSRLPVPIYLLLTLGIACILFCFAIIRFKKDKKSVIGIYLSIAFACFLIGLQSISKLYLPLLYASTKKTQWLIYISFFIGLVFMYYSAWTNKENPTARKGVLISLTFMAVAAILSIIAYITW